MSVHYVTAERPDGQGRVMTPCRTREDAERKRDQYIQDGYTDVHIKSKDHDEPLT